MSKELTEQEINDAIDSCHWRKDVHGVRVCKGECTPCFPHIEKGKCPMLRELFANATNPISGLSITDK